MLLEELNPIMLTEKLGNLRSLNVGPMIDILKQHKRYMGNRGRQDVAADAIGKKFADTQRGDIIAGKSEIVDIGALKDGIGGLRKAYKEHDDARAFAIYVDGTAVCFGLYDKDTLGGTARQGIFAFDLTMFKDKLDKEYDEKAKNKDEYYRQYHLKRRELKSDSSKEKYNYRSDKKEMEHYRGQATTTAKLKEFLEELETLAEGKKITLKLVLPDPTVGETRKGRYKHNMTKAEIFTGLEALKVRLQKYKISKKPTADTIEDFLKMAFEGSAKVIQFAGRGYSTTKQDSYDKVSPAGVLNGQAFSVDYKTVDPDSYERITVTYKFSPTNGTLLPFKAVWSDKETHKQITGVLDFDTYFKHEAKVKDVNKESIIKTILTKVKDGNTHDVRQMIDAARKAGHDYPEFNVIEKSLDAAKHKDLEV